MIGSSSGSTLGILTPAWIDSSTYRGLSQKRRKWLGHQSLSALHQLSQSSLSLLRKLRPKKPTRYTNLQTSPCRECRENSLFQNWRPRISFAPRDSLILPLPRFWSRCPTDSCLTFLGKCNPQHLKKYIQQKLQRSVSCYVWTEGVVVKEAVPTKSESFDSKAPPRHWHTQNALTEPMAPKGDAWIPSSVIFPQGQDHSWSPLVCRYLRLCL